MANYRMRFGSYDFPPGFAPMSQDSPKDIGEQELPRADGAVSQIARQQTRRLTVEGSAMGFGGGAAAIQSAVDAIRGACEGSGAVQPLWFGRDDRYINAQCVGLTESYPGGRGSAYGSNHKIAISFTAADPFFYAISATTAAGLTNAGGTITPGGNASAYAVWTITVTTGATGQITLTNTTSGQITTLGTAATAWANGDVIVLTRSKGVYSVTKNGLAAPGLLAGQIPTLAVGANVMTITKPVAMALAALQCAYTARWFN